LDDNLGGRIFVIDGGGGGGNKLMRMDVVVDVLHAMLWVFWGW